MTYDENVARDYVRVRRVHRKLLASLLSRTDLHAGSRVLELGCGTGNYICAIQGAKGCVAWGVDPSPDMLKRAQSQSVTVTWVCAPAENLGLSNAQFDFVFCVDAIHHFRDRLSAFREIHRLLSGGGIVGIATDSEEIIRTRMPLSIYWPETIDVDLARYPRLETLKAELKEAGFVGVQQSEICETGELSDISAYEAKGFPCLRGLAEDNNQRGLTRLKADINKGSVLYSSRYVILWAESPG